MCQLASKELHMVGKDTSKKFSGKIIFHSEDVCILHVLSILLGTTNNTGE
jgi:hypothetical protein